jgi:ketosteroid isomerase-like protein
MGLLSTQSARARSRRAIGLAPNWRFGREANDPFAWKQNFSRDTPGVSNQNVERLRAYLEAFDSEALSRGEVEFAYLAPDVTYADEILPDHVGEVYRGVEGIGRAGRAWLEPYETHSVKLERLIDAGDCVVSVHRVRAKARLSGIEFDLPLAWLFRFRDGMVIHWHAYPSEDEALEAADAPE